MTNYTNVLLDADNTIFDFNKAEKVALQMTFACFNTDCNDIIADDYHIINDMFWKRLEKNEITKEQLTTERFELLFDKYNLNLPPLDFNNRYKQYLGKQTFLLPDAEEIVKYLSNCGKRLIIASNGSSSIQNYRVTNSAIGEFIDGIFTSGEAGVAKPNPLFFELLLKKFNLNKDETIFIGDSISADILGGYNANIDTVFYSPTNEKCEFATYTISSLLEIKNIIK